MRRISTDGSIDVSVVPGSRASDYEFELPAGRIAHYPARRRDDSRLLVVRRDRERFEHLVFHDLVRLMSVGDVMVVNESRVMPARLLGRKPTGAPAEVLLLRPWKEGGVDTPEDLPSPDDAILWEALVRPGGKLKPGRVVVVSDELRVEIVDSTADGARVVRLDTHHSTAKALERFGRVPLPPYIDRPDEPLNRERYQTVYARSPGSVAAPTAGLHFTRGLLHTLSDAGVVCVPVQLHVGVGTFRPVEAEDPSAHQMHGELYSVGAQAAEAVNAARAAGRRVWAVGTTVVRALESAASADGIVHASAGVTRLFVRPPYRFRSVDAILTNFHLPRSTLLMLVAAFAGYDRTLAAYHEAIRGGYRFYSYGDAMAVL